MRSTTLALLMSLAATADADGHLMKFADAEQGAAFDKCIKIEDWNTKTLDDEVEVVAREEGGCCPNGTLPGVAHNMANTGAQVICGFTGEFTAVKVSTGAQTCTYNKCYVHKQGLTCKDDTKQLLNGCCGATWGKRTFKANCKGEDQPRNPGTGDLLPRLKTVYGNEYEWCISTDVDYRKLDDPRDDVDGYGRVGTDGFADDQKDGKLVVENMYVYTPCEGSFAGPATSDTVRTAAGAFGILGAIMMA